MGAALGACEVGDGGGGVGYGVRGAEGGAFGDEGADVGQAVVVEDFFCLSRNVAVGSEAEEFRDTAERFGVAGVVEGDDFGFEDCAVGEAALVRGFRYDHGVVHVVACVGDDGHDGVSTVRVVIQAVFVIEGGTDDGGLARLEEVGFVVRAVFEGSSGGAHGLFAHLALVHVPGRLVEVGERGLVGDDGEDVCGIVFEMAGLAGFDVVLRARY